MTAAERQKRYRARQRGEASQPVQEKPVTRVAPISDAGRFRNVDDLVELLESLPRVMVGRNGYEEKDRAADFIATFTTEQGRRVLAQIALICDPPSSINDADKNGTLSWKAGMRRVMNEIQRCFVIRAPITTERTPDAAGTKSDA